MTSHPDPFWHFYMDSPYTSSLTHCLVRMACGSCMLIGWSPESCKGAPYVGSKQHLGHFVNDILSAQARQGCTYQHAHREGPGEQG